MITLGQLLEKMDEVQRISKEIDWRGDLWVRLSRQMDYEGAEEQDQIILELKNKERELLATKLWREDD